MMIDDPGRKALQNGGECNDLTIAIDPNGSCLFAAGLSADIVGSHSIQTFSTLHAPHLGD